VDKMESIKTQFRGTRSLSKVSWKFLPISKINKPKKLSNSSLLIALSLRTV